MRARQGRRCSNRSRAIASITCRVCRASAVKTAAELIREYGDLDTLLASAEKIKQPKRREKLIEFAEQARISRDLVRLKDDCRSRFQSRASACTTFGPRSCSRLTRAMEFCLAHKAICREAWRPDPGQFTEKSVGSFDAKAKPAEAAVPKSDGVALHGPGTPAAGAAIHAAELRKVPFDRRSMNRDHHCSAREKGRSCHESRARRLRHRDRPRSIA